MSPTPKKSGRLQSIIETTSLLAARFAEQNLLERLRSIGMLLGSNVLATLIIAGATYLITQIVSPTEFGKYSLLAQSAMTIYPLLTLRYEQALPLVGNRSNANSLLALCLLLAVTFAALIVLVGSLGLHFAVIAARVPKDVVDQFPLVAIAAFALAVNGAFQSAELSRGTVSNLAVARVLRALAMAFLQIVFVVSIGARAIWLLLGEMSGNLVQAAFLTSALGLFAWSIPAKRFWPRILLRFRVLASRYRVFPIVTLPHMLIHGGLGLVFFSTLGVLYGAASLGLYYLMRKLIFGVLSLFSTAIYQHSIAEAARVPRRNLFRVAVQALVLTSAVTSVVAGLSFLFGPEVFKQILGAKWTDAGSFAAVSAPVILLEPVTSTFAFLPIFLNLQRTAFVVAVVQGLTSIGVLVLANRLGFSAAGAIGLASIAVSALMASYVVWLLLRSRNVVREGGSQ
jgi:O-antigen/teichoic acid export membrane protein